MLDAFVKALSQISEPRFRLVAVKGVLAAIAVYAVMIAGGWMLINGAPIQHDAWYGSILEYLGKFAVIVVCVTLFPTLVSVSISFFLEEIAGAVEARYYPDLPAPRRQTMGEILSGALHFSLVAIVLNLLVLPLYLVPGLNVLVFLGLNGYLLGRDYFELVAARRMETRAAKSLRGANSGSLWVSGAAIALLLTIPVVNIFAPILATAFMVHRFETWRGRQNA